MNILVIDAQGGGIGKQIVSALKKRYPEQYITAVGTNSLATSAMLKAGADVYEVQQMLGHSDIKTTTIYLRAIEEETRVNNRAVRILDKVLSESLGEGKNKLLDSAKYQ